MRLGIGSYAYAWSVGVPGSMPPQPMSVFGLLDKAIELGVSVVQVCDNLPLHLLSDSEVRRFTVRARESNLELEVGTRGIAADHLNNYLRLAQRLGSSILRVVIDASDHHPSIDEVVSTLKPLLFQFESADVCLAIENHDRFTANEFREILTRLPSRHIGICLDTVNSFGALEGPEAIVDTLAPWVVNLHIKEFTIGRVGHQMGFVIEGCPAGQGRLDVPWLVGRLRAAGRDCNAILEQWPAPENTLAETVAKEHRWAAESVAYLRTLIHD